MSRCYSQRPRLRRFAPYRLQRGTAGNRPAVALRLSGPRRVVCAGVRKSYASGSARAVHPGRSSRHVKRHGRVIDDSDNKTERQSRAPLVQGAEPIHGTCNRDRTSWYCRLRLPGVACRPGWHLLPVVVQNRGGRGDKPAGSNPGYQNACQYGATSGEESINERQDAIECLHPCDPGEW